MLIKTNWRLVFAALAFSFSTTLLYAHAPLAAGQSSTLLPDGTTLILGGASPQTWASSEAFLSASTESSPRKLENGMNFPRSGHTATVLPDGTVLIFGGVGYVCRKLDYPLAPMVLALVLGDMAEAALRQSLIMSQGSPLIFFTRPISAALVVLSLWLFVLPIVHPLLRRKTRKLTAQV